MEGEQAVHPPRYKGNLNSRLLVEGDVQGLHKSPTQPSQEDQTEFTAQVSHGLGVDSQSSKEETKMPARGLDFS